VSLLVRLALLGVPRHLRDSVLGDLLEQRQGAAAAFGLALHFQAEPYRDGTDRRAVLLLVLAAAGVLWLVPLAAQALLAQAVVFTDPFSRAALWVWGAPHGLAAAASGLLLGRASLLPRHADAARWHGVWLLAPAAAILAPGGAQATLAAALLPAAAWLAQVNRGQVPEAAGPA
jgi:hypothetical protein